MPAPMTMPTVIPMASMRRRMRRGASSSRSARALTAARADGARAKRSPTLTGQLRRAPGDGERSCERIARQLGDDAAPVTVGAGEREAKLVADDRCIGDRLLPATDGDRAIDLLELLLELEGAVDVARIVTDGPAP